MMNDECADSLRWGVPAKDANGETANSWDYCKQWIDRVEPFFVSLLGQRYGFVPNPQRIRDEADRRAYATLSITEMEIRHAVRSQPSDGCDRTREIVMRMERNTA